MAIFGVAGLDGKKLKELRRKAGKTQQEVADELGVHFTTVSKWERHGDLPQARIPQMASILGVPESELRGAPTPEDPPAGPTVQVVRSRAAQGEWMAAVIQGVEDRDLAWVLAAIGSLVDPDAWVASVTAEQIEEQSGNPEVFRAVWHKVLKSPWLKRIGEAEYVFQLVFPVEE